MFYLNNISLNATIFITLFYEAYMHTFNNNMSVQN